MRRRSFLLRGPALLGFTALFERTYLAQLPPLTKCVHCGTVKPMKISQPAPGAALDFLGSSRA